MHTSCGNSGPKLVMAFTVSNGPQEPGEAFFVLFCFIFDFEPTGLASSTHKSHSHTCPIKSRL